MAREGLSLMQSQPTAAPRRQTVQVPYSEAAIFARIAGMTLEAVEEDRYVRGSLIPPAQRRGCYVVVASSGARVPLLKLEAGWRES